MDDSTHTEFYDAKGASASAPIQAWGPFRIIAKVGQGGFGEVYRAFDTTIEREVALKLLLPRGRTTEAEAKAVIREARLMAKVRHPNVVAVYGVDAHDGRVGFWSDFVRGKTLSSLLALQGPFSPKETANIGIELAKAVGAVHGAGLLHRDIKTGNVMREEGGRILLMDFGLSEEKDTAATWAGTPPYMAPELFAGKTASNASDIYALGVVMFHLLTGKYPYERSVASRESLEKSAPMLRLLDTRPDLPERLVRVIEKAMDPDPAQRYASTGELISALSEAASLPAAVETTSTTTAGTSRWKTWMLIPAALAIGVGGYFAKSSPTAFSNSSSSAVTGPAREAHQLLEHYYRPNSSDKALALLQSIEEPKRTATVWADLARANMLQYRTLGDPKYKEPTIQAAERAIGLNPNLTSARVTLGFLYTFTNEYDLARESLDRALEIDSKSAEAHGALGGLWLEQDRKKDAEAEFKKAVELAPTDWRFAVLLAKSYDNNGDSDKARQYYSAAVENSPDNPRALANLGIFYWGQGNLEAAKPLLEHAIQLEPAPAPSSYFAYVTLALVAEQEGKYQDSVAYYTKATEAAPSSHLAWGGLGFSHRLIAGERQQAREAFEKAIKLAESERAQRPKDTNVLMNLGVYYAAIGNEAKATQFLKQASSLEPNSPDVLLQVGIGEELLSHREEAIEWIKKAIEHGKALQSVELQPVLKDLRADPRYQAVRKQLSQKP